MQAAHGAGKYRSRLRRTSAWNWPDFCQFGRIPFPHDRVVNVDQGVPWARNHIGHEHDVEMCGSYQDYHFLGGAGICPGPTASTCCHCCGQCQGFEADTLSDPGNWVGGVQDRRPVQGPTHPQSQKQGKGQGKGSGKAVKARGLFIC